MPALVYWDQWLSQCFAWDEVQQPATLFITDQQERQHVIQTLALKQSFRRGPYGHKNRGEELLQAGGGGLCCRQRCAKPPWHCWHPPPSVQQLHQGWRRAGTASLWQTTDHGSLSIITNEACCRAVCERLNNTDEPCGGHRCVWAATSSDLLIWDT